MNGRRRFVVASFHGDTNGLMTIPVVDALDKLMILKDVDEAAECEGGKPWLAPPPPLLIVGLDANTYVDHVPGKRLGVREFSDHIARREMATCWGVCDPRVHTTFNARTYLQPQLNKAVRMAERASSDMTDKNPKDHILFRDPRLVRPQRGHRRIRHGRGPTESAVRRAEARAGVLVPVRIPG